MTATAERLKQELAQLAIEERAEIAQFLIDSLEEETDEDAEAAFREELQRRSDDFDAGRAKGRPVEEVLEELRKKYS
jgi:putative addiction module component (TIGR02574 family)